MIGRMIIKRSQMKNKNHWICLLQMEGVTARIRSSGEDVSLSLLGRVGVGLLLCLILCGCITEYKPKGIDEVAEILVVEGIITDDESYITLSRSVTMSEADASWMSTQYVRNASVFVECDDNTRIAGYPDYNAGFNGGRYVIHTGKLNPERQYRLQIEIDAIEYRSEFSYPMQTPEIDSIFWMKRDRGQPVMIYVATHDPEGQIQFYRWSYKEDWEYHSDVYLDGYPFYCWSMSSNKDIMLGSTEKTVIGKLMDKVIEISPYDRKLSYLYRIDIKQNLISKKAYDYFSNIKKNTQQTGSIFAPIPSELRGNISCVTDPVRPVIGFVDVSSTTQKQQYIRHNGIYESSYDDECEIYDLPQLLEMYERIPPDFVEYEPKAKPPTYVRQKCVECTHYGGSTQKPEDWTNNY